MDEQCPADLKCGGSSLGWCSSCPNELVKIWQATQKELVVAFKFVDDESLKTGISLFYRILLVFQELEQETISIISRGKLKELLELLEKLKTEKARLLEDRDFRFKFEALEKELENILHEAWV